MSIPGVDVEARGQGPRGQRLHLRVGEVGHEQLLLEQVVERGEGRQDLLEVRAATLQHGLLLGQPTGRLAQLRREVEVVAPDRVGQVRGAQPVLGALRGHDGLELVPAAAAHVQQSGAPLDLRAKLLGLGAQLGDPCLGVGDLRGDRRLLGLCRREPRGDVGRLGAGLVEALLREREGAARRVGGRRVSHPAGERERPESDRGGDEGSHLVRCRPSERLA
jgi:hypothetical protein